MENIDDPDSFDDLVIMEEKQSTGVDPIKELLLSVHGLTSVIANIGAKQEQQQKDIRELKEKPIPWDTKFRVSQTLRQRRRRP
jgi:hypothetical protein